MSKLVYIIDDDTGLRTAYTAALHKLGYNVDSGCDGLEAQQLVKKKKPDLILLDMLMPNLDGIGFLKSLRQSKENAKIKVIVVSNFESMVEAQDLGIEKYLSKLQYTPDAVAAQADLALSTKA